MTDYSGNLPPAGWYPDPYGAPYERWWDGAQWTDHTNIPAAPEAVTPPVVVAPEPVAPSYPVTSEPAYQAPQQTAQPAFEQPQQTAQPAFHEPVQPTEQVQPVQEPYRTPVEQQPAWDTPVSAAGTSFDDIFSTGQAPSTPSAATQSAQPAYTEPVPASYGQPEPQSYQTAQPAYDPYASQQPQQAFAATPADSAGPDFGSLIAGGGASDPFDSWSNEDYEEPPRNTLATVGLTFGVLSFIIPGVAGLVGLVTSALGLTRSSRFKREEGVALGRGKSVAGIVLSVVGSAASIGAVIFLLPGILNPADDTTDDGSSAVVANAPKTDSGYIALEQGATGTILFADTTDPSIQFTVTGITPNPTCTGDPEQLLSPENGEFVALTMEFTTAAEYPSAMESGGLLQLAASNFVGVLPDGTEITNSNAGLSCVPEAEQLPTEIPAGETVTGTVVLDMSAATTSFTFSPSGVTGLAPATTRWEWSIPR